MKKQSTKEYYIDTGVTLVGAPSSRLSSFPARRRSTNMVWIPGQASLEENENAYPSCETVETVHCDDLSPAAFREKFMAKNLPVMITGLTENWRACREWVTKDGQPDIAFMSELFGDAKVLVVDCDEKIDTDLKRREMPFREFASWWQKADEKPDETSACVRKKLYVKDWNFVNDFPEYGAYVTPPHLKDDWLNPGDERDETDDEEYAIDPPNAGKITPASGKRLRGASSETDPDLGSESESESETESGSDGNAETVARESTRLLPGSYDFVYCGVKGTWTPMHVDVARSYSWSANVCGRKEWLLVPPRRTQFLRHRDGSGRFIPDAREAMAAPGSSFARDFPNAHLANPVVVEQPPGAVLFVPSCWAHQVHNASDCVSVNRNWFNSFSFHVSASYLRNETRLLREGLPGRDDRADGILCQQLLARRAGIEQVQLAAIGAWALRRMMRRLGEVRQALKEGAEPGSRRDPQKSHRSSVSRLRSRRQTLTAAGRSLWAVLQHVYFETHLLVVPEAFEEAFGEDFEEGDPGDEARRESGTSDDAFVESYEVSPWDEDEDGRARLAAVLRRAAHSCRKTNRKERRFLLPG